MELIAFLPFILRFSKMLMLLNKRIKVHTYTHPRTHFYMQTKCLQPLVRPPSIAFVTSRRKNDSCIVPTYSSSVTGTQKFGMNNDASWMKEDEGEEDEEEERGYRRIRDDCQAPSSQIHCFNQSPKGIKWSVVLLPCSTFLGFHGGKQGSSPDRGQSPVEWGDFLYVCLSPPLGHPARPEAQPARPEAQPARSEAQPARSGAQPASQDGRTDGQTKNLPIL